MRVTYDYTVEYEDTPVRGNLIVSGDVELDKQDEDEVIRRLAAGDVWAWCWVRVTATWEDWTGEASLGCCCYGGENDFLSDCYGDLKMAAYDDLKAKLERVRALLSGAE
jgi:hypothetical protein